MQPANKHASREHPSWFALYARSRCEKVVSLTLESLGVTHFLPLIHEKRRWSDRSKVIDVPRFPGYLFVRIASTADLQLSIRKISGVIDFVGNQNGPATVPDNEIEGVRALLCHGSDCSAHSFLAVGDRVRIVRGALKGIEGTLIRCGTRSRVFVSVQIIQRAVSVEVADSDVEALGHQGILPAMALPEVCWK